MPDVNSDGGEVLELVLGLADGLYLVDLGVDPLVSAIRAYSAVPGLRDRARSRGGTLTFAVPRLVSADNYRALITPVGGGPSVLTGPLFDARRRPLFSATYALRRALPSAWAVGPTTPEAEDVP